MNPGDLDEAILDVVGHIPAGTLASYGDVADVVSEIVAPCSARLVARCLSRFGAEVPWWRVVQAGGTIAEEVLPAARTLLVAEGVVVNGRRVPLAALRWRPDLAGLQRALQEGR